MQLWKLATTRVNFNGRRRLISNNKIINIKLANWKPGYLQNHCSYKQTKHRGSVYQAMKKTVMRQNRWKSKHLQKNEEAEGESNARKLKPKRKAWINWLLPQPSLLTTTNESKGPKGCQKTNTQAKNNNNGKETCQPCHSKMAGVIDPTQQLSTINNTNNWQVHYEERTTTKEKRINRDSKGHRSLHSLRVVR